MNFYYKLTDGLVNFISFISEVLFHGYYGLLFFWALISSIFILSVYKWLIPERKIKRIKKGIKGHLLGLIIFSDEVTKIFRNFLLLMKYNFSYIVVALRGFIVIFIPLIILINALSFFYSRKPARINNEIMVSVKTSSMDADINICKNKNYVKVSGPSFFPGDSTVAWKIKPLKNGTHRIRFILDSSFIEKSLVVGESLIPVSPLKSERILPLFQSFEKIEERIPIKEIKIHYPERKNFAGSLIIPWWLIYIAETILITFILAKIFSIEI